MQSTSRSSTTSRTEAQSPTRTEAPAPTPVPWSNRWRCAELGLDGGGVDPHDPAMWGPEGPFAALFEGLLPSSAAAIHAPAAPSVGIAQEPTAGALPSSSATTDAVSTATPAAPGLMETAVGVIAGVVDAVASAAGGGAALETAAPTESTPGEDFRTRAGEVMDEAAVALHAQSAATDAGRRAALEALLAEPELTVEQVAEARALIAQLPEAEQADAYRTLAQRSPYASQRDNTDAREKEQGGTCFVTSVAMALMQLGVPNPDPSVEYEAALLAMAEGDIEFTSTWRNVAERLGVASEEYGEKTINDWTEEQWRSFVEDTIGSGKSAILSLVGHVVRIEGWSEAGLLIDDPYGTTVINATGKTGSNGKPRYFADRNERGADEGTEGANVGEHAAYPWADVVAHTFKYIVTFG